MHARSIAQGTNYYCRLIIISIILITHRYSDDDDGGGFDWLLAETIFPPLPNPRRGYMHM